MLNTNNMQIIKESSKQGVTLVEIMIAFLILCSTVFGIVGMISFGHKGTRTDFRQGEAIQILIDRMNKLSALKFSRLKSLIVDLGENTELDNPIIEENIEFGTVTPANGQNEYKVTFALCYKKVRFDYLYELEFPNESYDPQKPSTWKMKLRDPANKELLYDVIQIKVTVKPINFKMNGKERNEKEVSAITYVANLED